MENDLLTAEAVELLARMVATPSVSRSEDAVANVVEQYLRGRGFDTWRIYNNVVAMPPTFNPARPILMLNSHLDTVKPAASYTRDPFSPTIEGGRLYGLGSNDAGASVVSLTQTFCALADKPLPFNLILCLSAEEEVGGEKGMRALLPALAEKGITPAAAIVGEPTGMQAAVAERGLVVLDCITEGVSGHAARGEGVNAIYRAIADIEALRGYSAPAVSETLGPIGINITQINAGRAHNVVPDRCEWVVDVRTTDAYTNEQTVELLRAAVSGHSTLTPRSTRVRASVISLSHPLVKAARNIGAEPFVSPTTSDMSLMHGLPSLKIGPGQSARSHSADEYVEISEIASAIPAYIQLIKKIESL